MKNRLCCVLIIVWLAIGCAGKKKPKPKTVATSAPARCVVVDNFPEPCVQPKGDPGYVCPNTHIVIKPTPECNEFRTQTVSVEDLKKK